MTLIIIIIINTDFQFAVLVWLNKQYNILQTINLSIIKYKKKRHVYLHNSSLLRVLAFAREPLLLLCDTQREILHKQLFIHHINNYSYTTQFNNISAQIVSLWFACLKAKI